MDSIIKIDTQAVTKLVEVVSSGIGTLYKPRAIRNEADAEAYKMEVLAKAEAKKTLIEGDAKIELIERAKQRLGNIEINRQINIEEIAEKSIKYLDENVSEKPVEDDWKTRYFNKAQDVSDEDMQEIWAKILAVEVSKPGTISLRTLEIISNLSKIEAEKFQIACTLATDKSFIWKLNSQNSLNDFNLNYGDLMILRDAGLTHYNDNLILTHKYIPQISGTIVLIGNKHYHIKYPNNFEGRDFIINQIAFTKAGEELCILIDIELNVNYLNKIIENKKNEGYEILNIQDNSNL